MAYNSHGHTPAAWTTVLLVFLAFVVGGIAVIQQNWLMFWLGGVGLVVLAGIVGKVMQMMGLGQVDHQAHADEAQEDGDAEASDRTEGLAQPSGVAQPAEESSS